MKNNAWLILIVAAICEVGWATGLKLSEHWLSMLVTILLILASMYLLIVASTKIPVGTCYVLFVALGTAGTTLVDMFVLGNQLNWLVILFIVIILISVIGLKKTS